MRRHVSLLLIPALSLLTLWAVSCQDTLRENLPVLNFDLAEVVLDLSLAPPDLTPVDLAPVPPDGGGDGGASDGMPRG